MAQEILSNKRTKILFIQNYYWRNLGIMSISAVLKQHGFETDIAVGDPDTILKQVQEKRPRLVGFYATTGFHHRQLKLAREIKARFGDKITTVFGGPHPTFVTDILKDEGVDIICRGEGEYALLELMQAMEENRDYTTIKNLNVKLDGKIHKNPLRLLCDLDALPFPDREIYRSVPFIYSSRQHEVIHSKGCPYNCAFCTAPAFRNIYKDHGNYLRFRSIEKVIEELLRIKMRYAPRSFYFFDETFFLDDEYSSKFLEAYKAKINVPYICMMRADLVNEKVASILKDTGCSFLLFGIEHGNEALRNRLLEKKLSNDAIFSCATNLKKYRIPFATLNIVGFPGDNISHVWDAIQINTLVRPNWSRFFIYQVLPATKLADYSLKNGFVEAVDVASSDATMLASGAILRKSREYKRTLRLKYLANIFIKFPFLRRIASSVLLNIPADPFFRVLEKTIEFFNFFWNQQPGCRSSEKLSIAWFYIKHRDEFE